MDYSLRSNGTHWFKGNLHSHTTKSDGRVDPDVLVEHYRAAGYDFLSITDHRWFGYYPEFCNDGFLVLPGMEGDIPEKVGTHHAVALGSSDWEARRDTKFPVQVISEDTGQDLVDQLHNLGGLVMYAHPVWSRRDVEEIRHLQGVHLLEIYNHGCAWENHTGLATHFWDSMLRHGRRVWGTAVDDCHRLEGDSLGGWVVVRTNQLKEEDLLRALQAGQFYASNGPEIFEWRCEGMDFLIQCSPAVSVHFVAYEPHGESVHAAEGQTLTEARFRARGGETYVRAEIVDARGRTAWTNPIFLQES